ncbi:MAG: hypothetical protein JW913_09015 [Chitinispirillaceae bacterium]|nr:hypothetical protein [Chitinispirillaceae bacterium]
MLFRIYTVFYLLLYLFVTFDPKAIVHYGVWEAIDIVVMLVSLAGMAAYTFQFRIINRRFWEYFFYLFIIFEMVYMTWLQFPLLEKLHLNDHVAASNLINTVMLLPIVYALFRLQQRWNTMFPAAGTKPPLDGVV